MERVEFIAKVRYLGWICYQLGAGLELHDVNSNHDISDERLASLIEGTKLVLDNPILTPEDNHVAWMQSKLKQGYKYGDTLNVENKTHPSLVPYGDLSEVEKLKDYMDILMVQLADKLYNEILNG